MKSIRSRGGAQEQIVSKNGKSLVELVSNQRQPIWVSKWSSMSNACTQIGFNSIPKVLLVWHKKLCFKYMQTCDSCIVKLILQVFRVAEAESDAIEVLQCYLSLSVKKVKNGVFSKKTEILALRRLYYRFFVPLKLIMNSLARYQFSLSVKK